MPLLPRSQLVVHILRRPLLVKEMVPRVSMDDMLVEKGEEEDFITSGNVAKKIGDNLRPRLYTGQGR